MKNGRLRVLHTSDWHIGHMLFDQKRDEEFRFFFEWLADTIKEEAVDCLLVAGDVFDSSNPSSRQQQMYYNYLLRFKEAGCRHIVITAGNHDPAILLDAPSGLCRNMDIHILGEPDIQNPENEILLLRNPLDEPELIVCAVPYLRERYVRKAAAGESAREKEENIAQGIRAHYANVAEKARAIVDKCRCRLPLIAMGHLFAGKNANLQSGETERILYVGTLGQVGSEIFEDIFDYVALGHLHMAQTVGDRENMRYSGSPLPMAFSESEHEKSVCLIEFDGNVPNIKILPIPSFRSLFRISGDLQAIEEAIDNITVEGEGLRPWLEIIYNGNETLGNLRERVEELGKQKGVEILAIRDLRSGNSHYMQAEAREELGELDPETVFIRCLCSKNVPEEHWPDLLEAFNEVYAHIVTDNEN